MKYLSKEPFHVPIKNNTISSKPSCDTCNYYKNKKYWFKCTNCVNWDRYKRKNEM